MQRDPDEEHGWDDRRQRKLRQEPREVRLERIGAVEHGARDLPGLQRTEPAGPCPHELREHPLTQRHERGRRRERSAALERPAERPTRDGHGGECDQRLPERVEPFVAEKRTGDDATEQRRLRDDGGGGEKSEHAAGAEVPAHGGNLPHEPRVERAHFLGRGAGALRGECAIASSGVAGSPVRRARNTQYVQA